MTVPVAVPISDFVFYVAVASTIHQGLKVLYRKIWNHKR